MITENFPYSNFHEMNLDWILAQVKKLEAKLTDFININTIKYANPITWSIVRQYEANTVVVDGLTGNAYISTRPVPVGVSINNTDYWTVIYNYQNLINKLEEQIAAANEKDSTTATAARAEGALVWLSDSLYRVTRAMLAGDQYILNENIEKITIEDVIANLAEYVDDEVEALTQAINIVDGKTLPAGGTTGQILFKHSDDDYDGIWGNIPDPHNLFINVKDYGAVGDGETNDVEAFTEAFSECIRLYIPSGTYLLDMDDSIDISDITIYMDPDAIILVNQALIPYGNVTIIGGTIKTTTQYASPLKPGLNSFLTIKHTTIDVDASDATAIWTKGDVFVDSCIFNLHNKANFGINCDNSPYTQRVVVINSTFNNSYLNAIFVSNIETEIRSCVFNNCHSQSIPTGGGAIDIRPRGINIHALIESCLISNTVNSVASGIEIEDGGNFTAIGNIINCLYSGIANQNGTLVAINNIITNGTVGGVFIKGATTDTTLIRNTLKQNASNPNVQVAQYSAKAHLTDINNIYEGVFVVCPDEAYNNIPLFMTKYYYDDELANNASIKFWSDTDKTILVIRDGDCTMYWLTKSGTTVTKIAGEGASISVANDNGAVSILNSGTSATFKVKIL